MTMYRIRPHNWRLDGKDWIATEPRRAVIEQAPGGWSAWTEGDHDQQADETVYATAEEAMRRVEEQHREQFLRYLEPVTDRTSADRRERHDALRRAIATDEKWTTEDSTDAT